MLSGSLYLFECAAFSKGEKYAIDNRRRPCCDVRSAGREIGRWEIEDACDAVRARSIVS